MSQVPDHDTGSDYQRKWLHREPEMGLVMRFVPGAQREAFVRWGVLLSELREAAFELSEPRVAAAKTAWWAEELVRIAAGGGRHPLSVGLEPGLPWLPVARALLALDEHRDRPSTPEEALGGVAPLGHALAQLELAWFQLNADGGTDGRALTVHVLVQPLLAGRAGAVGARIPMSLLARHGCVPGDLGNASGAPVLSDWARELSGHLPDGLEPAGLFRRLRTQLDREQLRHLQGQPLHAWRPGMGTVLRGWRAARRSR